MSCKTLFTRFGQGEKTKGCEKINNIKNGELQEDVISN